MLEFIRDNESGCVVENNPRDIAEKISWLYENTDQAKKLGETGYQMVSHLNWDYLIEQNILKHL